MIHHECEQGSVEWLEARRGKPTASNFGAIVTPAALKTNGAGAVTYAARLAGEIIRGRYSDEFTSYEMDQGIRMEPQARGTYALYSGEDPIEVGFITTDDGLVGCSPDAMCGDDGGWEGKATDKADKQIKYLLDPSTLAADHKAQVQGCMWVTGRQWWDLTSFCPGLPLARVRCYPDLAYQLALDDAIPEFLARVQSMVDYVRAYDPCEGLDANARAAAEVFGN